MATARITRRKIIAGSIAGPVIGFFLTPPGRRIIGTIARNFGQGIGEAIASRTGLAPASPECDDNLVYAPGPAPLVSKSLAGELTPPKPTIGPINANQTAVGVCEVSFVANYLTSPDHIAVPVLQPADADWYFPAQLPVPRDSQGVYHSLMEFDPRNPVINIWVFALDLEGRGMIRQHLLELARRKAWWEGMQRPDGILAERLFVWNVPQRTAHASGATADTKSNTTAAVGSAPQRIPVISQEKTPSNHTISEGRK